MQFLPPLPYQVRPGACFTKSLSTGLSRVSLAAVGLVVGLFAQPCTAQSDAIQASKIRLSGFGTVGMVHAEAPRGWQFRRNSAQPAMNRSTRLDVDSRLGLQVNYALNAQVELVAQALAARSNSGTPAGNAIEWAFAAYRPTPYLTLRAGRLNLDQFVMSDYRNVGFAYLYARPPVEYYGSIPTNLEGMDLSHTWNGDETRWVLKGFAGRSDSAGIPLDDAFGFALTRESGGLTLRAGMSRTQLRRNWSDTTLLLNALDQVRQVPVPNVPASARFFQTQLDMAAGPLTYITFGVTFERSLWQFAAEITRVNLATHNVGAGYASIARRAGPVTLFGMVSGSWNAAPAETVPQWGAALAPVLGPTAAQQAQQLAATAARAAATSTRQTTCSLGARWDVHPRMAVKIQWDHTKIGGNGGSMWVNSDGSAGTANVGTILLDFVY
jgi:hypothetical protein